MLDQRAEPVEFDRVAIGTKDHVGGCPCWDRDRGLQPPTRPAGSAWSIAA